MLLIHSFVFLTTLLVFLGAFSRFTHGIYTPRYYAYQEYHQPDDGSTVAQIAPFADSVLGFMLLSKKTRVYAAIIVDFFMIVGLMMQISARKRFEIDLVMVGVATAAVVQAKTSRQRGG